MPATSHVRIVRPAPSWVFIGPPAAMKPDVPKIVTVSMICSTNVTAASTPTQRGSWPPRRPAHASGPSVKTVNPVSVGPQ